MSARSAVAVLGFLLASPLAAQGNGVEIGFDGVIQRQLSEDAGKFTIAALPGGSTSVPFGAFRVGFPVGSRFHLEPGFGFGLLHIDGFDDDFKTWHAMLGGVIDIGARGAGVSPFIRPFVGYSSIGAGEQSSFVEAGVGIGARLRLAERMAVRLELNYAHGFEHNDDFIPSQDFVNLRFGLSMFTK